VLAKTLKISHPNQTFIFFPIQAKRLKKLFARLVLSQYDVLKLFQKSNLMGNNNEKP
jgi:hypothetical protein